MLIFLINLPNFLFFIRWVHLAEAVHTSKMYRQVAKAALERIADGQIGASGKSLFSGAAIGDVIRDKWPAIRHEVVRRYSPVQHMPLLGLLVYFLP